MTNSATAEADVSLRPDDPAVDAPLDDVRRAADSGDMAAMTEVACRLLIGRAAPLSPQEGVALLARAADAGNADAMAIQATLLAAGAWLPQSWPQALDRLCTAAEHGAEQARTQLRILAHETAPISQDAGQWAALRARVDLHGFVTPSEREQVSQAPRVWAAKGVASHALCDFLIGHARGHLQRAKMYDASTRTAQFEASRSCSEFKFDITTGGMVMLLLRMKIAALTSLPPIQMEPPQIFHYALGEEIKPHYDFFRKEGIAGYGSDGSYEGDRIATSILYLNDDFEGGELSFPKVGFQHKGRKGDLVFLANFTDGKPDPLSLHAGLPVTKGEKWIVSQWIHDRPFTATA
ncbi:MAG TPA: 2OG-Fe(II) oxygenase [Rhizomicrobium sp.]